MEHLEPSQFAGAHICLARHGVVLARPFLDLVPGYPSSTFLNPDRIHLSLLSKSSPSDREIITASQSDFSSATSTGDWNGRNEPQLLVTTNAWMKTARIIYCPDLHSSLLTD